MADQTAERLPHRAPRDRFAGLSYGGASRAALALIREAAASGSWVGDLPEALAELRGVMSRRMREG